MLISSNAKSTFEWIQLLVSENQELVFVEKPLDCKHTMCNLKSISVETLKNQVTKIVQVIELDLAKILPKKFGITIDGWSEFSIHYVAVFAVGASVPNGKVLLGFSPFEDEADLTAEQHGLYLSQLLPNFKWSMIDIIYLVGDNCTVNKKLSRNLEIPLVGFNSHKQKFGSSNVFGLEFC
jgi:hypothetical protein